MCKAISGPLVAAALPIYLTARTILRFPGSEHHARGFDRAVVHARAFPFVCQLFLRVCCLPEIRDLIETSSINTIIKP